MSRHISAHRAATKYFSNCVVFKTKIEEEGLSGGSPAALGAGGLRFKSARPDQTFPSVANQGAPGFSHNLMRMVTHSKERATLQVRW